MDAYALLRAQADNADKLLLQICASVTPEQAAWRLSGSTANTIAATFLHTYYSEDDLIQGLRGMGTVFEDGGWQQRVGYNPAAAWTLEMKPETSLLLDYGAAVYAATTGYLASLAPEALDSEIATSRGRRKLATRLDVYLVSHKLQHAGEISALLGCQGLKGLP